MATHRAIALAALLGALMLTSCKKTPPPDGVCTYEPTPAGGDIPAGQGGVQILGATDTYFYVFDNTGTQIASGGVNRLVALKPGEYQVKINNSAHPVSVQSKTMAKCATGTALGKGATDEYYYIFNDTGTQLAANKLGSALSLFPGKYQARLNNTSIPAEIKPNATTELKPGILNVTGSTDEYYYVFNSTGTQLAANKIGHALGLFAGSYNAKVNNSAAPVTITAGGTTELPTGAVTVQGTTDEYYYVFNSVGTQLAANKLNRALSFIPGDYTAKVNNAVIPVHVDASRTSEYQTGTLTVKGSGTDYFYVFDTNGTQLGASKLNQPMSFPAGCYSVKVGEITRQAAVTAGQSMVLN